MYVLAYGVPVSGRSSSHIEINCLLGSVRLAMHLCW